MVLHVRTRLQPPCPGGATAGGGCRQVVVSSPSGSDASSRTPAVPHPAIWRFRRKLAIIRWPARAAIHSNCKRALVQQPIITPSSGAFATQRNQADRPVIAALRQAATNLKKLEQWPSGAHPAAPAFRDSACRACAAARACTQEAPRR
ncbi:hypothetical protein [Burkholderia anthina]|uniref:hypothetical protein n=1 Tax=Burkholderia anthina TaxID=179879 RepID=UPI001FC85E6F|nr:hypothetical protein [Burkholderia anthina]